MASLLEQQATEPQEDVGQSTRKQFEASNMFMSDAGAAELFKDFGTYVDRGVEGVERAITEIGDFFKENIKPTDFVPGAGTVDASKAAGDRFAKGDYLGAGMGVVEGVASTALDAVGSAGGAAGMAGVGILRGGARAVGRKIDDVAEGLLAKPAPFKPKVQELSEQAKKDFTDLGEAQRTLPEQQGQRVRKLTHSPVGPVMEHVGDLTHRMTERLKYKGANDDMGLHYVRTKIKTALNHLKANLDDGNIPYKQNHTDALESGFEHWKKNPGSKDIPDTVKTFDEYKKFIQDEMSVYADAHAELKVYNRPQYLAREAAVAVGRNDPDKAIKYLEELQDLASRPNDYVFASKVHGPARSKGMLSKQESTPAKRKSQNVMAGTAGAAVVGGGMLAKPDSAEASTAASVPKAPTKDFSALWGRLYQGKSDPAKIKDFQQDVKRLYGKAPKEEVLVDMSNKAAVAFAADVDMDPSEFSELMYVTALHESSGGRHKVQGGAGRARGYWQVEPETAVDLVKNSLALFGPQFTKATGLSKKDLQGLGIHQFKRILMDPKVTAMFAAAKYVAAIQNDRK